MATLGSKIGTANENGKESDIDSVPMWAPEDEGPKSGEIVVRLPTVDSRQPNTDGAKALVAPRLKRKNLKTSVASALLFPRELQIHVQLPPTASATNSQNRPLEKATRSRIKRGTRGRGDYRNARMRADKVRGEAEQLVNRQTTLLSTLQSSKLTSALLFYLVWFS